MKILGSLQSLKIECIAVRQLRRLPHGVFCRPAYNWTMASIVVMSLKLRQGVTYPPLQVYIAHVFLCDFYVFFLHLYNICNVWDNLPRNHSNLAVEGAPEIFLSAMYCDLRQDEHASRLFGCTLFCGCYKHIIVDICTVPLLDTLYWTKVNAE